MLSRELEMQTVSRGYQSHRGDSKAMTGPGGHPLEGKPPGRKKQGSERQEADS